MAVAGVLGSTKASEGSLQNNIIRFLHLTQYQSSKLAGEGGGLLVPLYEREDSGIDSDDTERRLTLADKPSEGSSSEDDSVDWRGIMNEGQVMKTVKDGAQDGLDEMQWPPRYSKDDKSGDISPDRSSPPLYEVELTASDEDDDASVLELVIPMQSRYQRVPTSSPKKTKPKVKKYLCGIICCGRK